MWAPSALLLLTTLQADSPARNDRQRTNIFPHTSKADIALESLSATETGGSVERKPH